MFLLRKLSVTDGSWTWVVCNFLSSVIIHGHDDYPHSVNERMGVQRS